MKKVAFCTLGCKVNQYDTEALLSLFLSEGYIAVPFEEKADVYVVNTCTVTGTADKKSRQMLSRAGKTNPGALVIAAGCLAQRTPEALIKAGADMAIGIKNRADILKAINSHQKNAVKNFTDDEYFEELKISSGGEKTRGYLKIQEGCNNLCSYCVIPYVRGPDRSREFTNIADEAKRLADSDKKEIVITGIHIDSYDNQGKGLIDVIEAVSRIDGIKRIRLGSLEPGRLSEDNIRKMADIEKLCPHFHISLQSGCDAVLKRMNRRYTVNEYSAYIDTIRHYFYIPAITTDIIAGFPEETKAEHETTCAFVRNAGFSRLHVFTYSGREGTDAVKMRGLPKTIKQKRTNELIKIGKNSEQAYMLRFLGKKEEILFEEEDKDLKGNYTGYSRRYIRASAPAKENEIKKVLITGIKGDKLIGR